MGRKSYNIEDIDKVLGVLAKNSGNVKKTARETGVAINTLKKWKNQDPDKYEVIEEQTLSMLKDAQMIVLQNQIQSCLCHTENVRNNTT